MKWLKVTVSLCALLLWGGISAIPVEASSTGEIVEPNEPVKGTSLVRSEPVRQESGPRGRTEQARQRPQVERLPKRLPRWYPPRLCGKKSSRCKEQSGCNRRQKGPQKQKRGRLPIEQNETPNKPGQPVWTGDNVSVAGPGLSWGQTSWSEPLPDIVNEEMGLEVSPFFQTSQTAAWSTLFSEPIATQSVMMGQLEVEQYQAATPDCPTPISALSPKESPDTSLDSPTAVTYPDPEVDKEWATQQWGQTELGDKRRTRRAVLMGERMALNPGGSIPEQMGSWSASKAAYLLLNEKDVTLDNLSQPHWIQTRQAAGQEQVVLMIQDTTEMDFTHQPHIKNLGPIGDGRGRGFLLHSVIAFVPGLQTVLGLAHQQAILRIPHLEDQPPKKWARTPESLVWEKATQAVGKPPEGTIWVQMGDRGSDSFGFMASCDPENDLHFLIRLKSNRVLDWSDRTDPAPPVGDPERYLISYARTLPAYGQTFTVEVAARKGQPRRTATVQLSWAQVTIPVPKGAPQQLQQYQSIKAWVVRVWEVNPPPKVEQVEWTLLSSLPVLSWDDAHQRCQWYAQRWLIEDFHKALKSGCRIERTQLDDRLDIERLLGFLSPIALRLLQIRQIARQAPDTPAHSEIDPLPLRILATALQTNPTTMTIAQFWAGVAQLGGYLGRTSDGPPGWITLWRGYRQLQLMVRGARFVLDPEQGLTLY